MKTYQFLFFFLVTPLAVSGQNYIPLPEQNAIWNIDLQSINCSGPPAGYCYSKSFSIIKDTTIGGYLYHLTDYPDEGVTNFIPAFRQDTINRKVYFPWEISPGVYVDTILFDYTLNVGDSIPELIQGPGIPQYLLIQSIDSVFNGNIYIRRWNFAQPSSGLTTLWMYEGVGNQMGLFGPFTSFESSFALVCMSKNGQAFFPSDTSSCTVVDIDEKNNVFVRVFPTVALSGGVLHLDILDLSMIKSINIYNSLYNNTVPISEISHQLKLPALPSGIYLLVVELNNHKKVSFKLIII